MFFHLFAITNNSMKSFNRSGEKLNSQCSALISQTKLSSLSIHKSLFHKRRHGRPGSIEALLTLIINLALVERDIWIAIKMDN